MPTKTRVITVCILILLGGALFSYYAAFYPLEIAAQAQSISTTAVESENDAEQEKPCQLNQTPAENKPRPRPAAT